MTTAPSTMLSDIEEAIVKQILANVQGATEADNSPDSLMAKAPVAIAVRIVAMSFQHITMSKVKVLPTISVLIAVKNLQGYKERRAKIVPLLLGVIACLSEQSLGLDMHDLCPESARELQHEQLNTAGMILYECLFKTWFVAVLNQETAQELLSIYNDVQLQETPFAHQVEESTV